MKAVLIGEVKFSAAMLEVILESQVELAGVVTRMHRNVSADKVNLTAYASSLGVPCQEVRSVNSTEAYAWIARQEPDLILCLGWSEIVKSSVLALAPGRVIGYHPARLPRNRGRHPIIWALALGLESTASTFFVMEADVDAGPIVSQTEVPIGYGDYASDLYERLVGTAQSQLRAILAAAASGSLVSRPQSSAHATWWRRRSDADGFIDWRMGTDTIRNLVRALAPPYPGASFRYHGDRITVLRAEVVSGPSSDLEPGLVVARRGSSIIVKTGDGALLVSMPLGSPSISAGEYL